MARPSFIPSETDDEEEWLTRHRTELAMLSGRSGSGGAMPPGARQVLERERGSAPRDPFAPLKPIGDFAGNVVRLMDPEYKLEQRREIYRKAGLDPADVDDTFDPPSQFMRGLGWVGENVIDPGIGIIQKAADPTGTLQRHYEKVRGDAPAWDIGATTRAAGSVKREFDTALQRIQEDPDADPKARTLTAALRGATLGADFAIPLPAAKYLGIKRAPDARVPSPLTDKLKQIGSDIYEGDIFPAERPSFLPPEPQRVTAGRSKNPDFDPEDANLAPDALATKYYEHALRIVTGIARKRAIRLPPHYQKQAMEEFVADGMVGYVEAAHHFKADQGVPFLGFAIPRIEGAMVDALRAKDPLTRGQRQAGETVESEASLDAPLMGATGDLTSMTLADKIAAPGGSALDLGAAARGPAAEAYRRGLPKLSPEQQAVLKLRHERGMTLEEIAVELGADQSWISRLASTARTTLRAELDRVTQGGAESGRSGEQLRLPDERAATGGVPGLAGAELPGGSGPGRAGPGLPDVRAGGPGRATGGRETAVRKRARELLQRLEREEKASGPGAQPARHFVQTVGKRHYVIDRDTKAVVGRFEGEAGKAEAQQLADRRNADIEEQALFDVPEERTDLALRNPEVTDEAARSTRVEAEQPRLAEEPALDGPTAHTAKLDQTAQRYGFASADEAAAAIARFRQKASVEGEGPRVLRIPRPVQDQLLAQVELRGQPLRDADEIGSELTDLDAQIRTTEDALQQAKKSRTRTRFSKAQQRKVTTHGAGAGGVDAARQSLDGLLARKELLLREREHGMAVRQAGPLPEKLTESEARAEAVTEGTRAPEGETALLPRIAAETPLRNEAPIEGRRRASEARGRAIGQREAIEAVRKQIDDAVGDLTKRLGTEGGAQAPSARKVAATLKAIADDREAGLPRQKIGKKGAVRKSAQYRMLHSREVQPLLDVRKNMTRALDRLSQIDKGELGWAQLTVPEQIRKLANEHPDINLDLFLDEWQKRTSETRQEVVDELNDFLRQHEDAALEPGEIPSGFEKKFPRVGQTDEAARLRAEREGLLLDVQDYLRQAEELGVDAAAVDPVRRALTTTIDRVKALRESIEKMDLPDVPAKGRREGDYVGSLNLDYIANPLMREAIREHYLKPGNAVKIEEATRRMSVEELNRSVSDMAAMLGNDPDAILAYVAQKLPDRGSVAPFIMLAREAIHSSVMEMQALARRGVTDERWDKSMAHFDAFVMELNPASSEAGRALRFHQEIAGRNFQDARDAAPALETANRLFQQKDAEWREAVRKAEVAAQRALDAKAKAEALRNPMNERARQQAEAAALKAEEAATQQRIALDRIQMAELAARERLRKARLEILTEGLVRARQKGATPEAIRALASLDPATQFQEIVNLIRSIDPATGGEKLTGIVLNSIYSGVRANEANLIGNAWRLGLKFIGDPIAARTSAPVIARITGRDAGVVPQEWDFAWAALKHATPRALRNYLQIQKEGRGAADILEEIPAGSKFELGAPDTFKGPWGNLAEGALRMLSGIDAAFFHLSYHVEYETMLARRAVLDGARTQAEIADRMVDYIIKPPEDLAQFAGKTAADLTYRNALDRFTDGLVRLVATPVPLPDRIAIPGRAADFDAAQAAIRVARSPDELQAATAALDASSVRFLGDTPVGKWFLTPIMFTMNAAKYAITAAGGGLVAAPYQAWRTGRLLRAAKITPDQAAYMDRVAARTGIVGAAGALMLTDAVLAFMNGDLTGDGPQDPTRNRVWRMAGNQRRSRRINGQWHSYEQMWPASAAYHFVSSVGDALEEGRLQEEEAFELTVRASAAFSKVLVDQPFLRNTASFYEFIDNAERGGIGRAVESYAAMTARKFEPWSSFMRDMTRTLDASVRDPQTFVEFLEANIPLLSTNVRTALSRWGDEVPQRPAGISYLIPGAGVSLPDDPVETEVRRLEAIRRRGEPILQSVGFVSDEVAGVELDDDQRHFYQRTAGQLAHARVQALIGSVSYGGWTDEQRAKEVRKIVDAARKDARRAVADKLIGVMTLPDGQKAVIDTGAESRAKGMRIGLSESKSVYARTKLFEKWSSIVDTDPELQAAFDEHKGTDDLSLAQYRQLVPLVRWYEAQPEFADPQGRPIGSAAQWEQYHREYREWTRTRRDQGPVGARLYFLSHPVLQVFTKLSQRPGGKNAQVTVARLQTPLLNRVKLPNEEQDDLELAPAVGQ